MIPSTVEEVLSLVKEHGEITLRGDEDIMMRISHGQDCYLIMQGSPKSLYGQNIYTPQKARDFIIGQLRRGVYKTVSI